jgi:hypothetical protein
MNLPIPDHLRNKFSVVYDGGTLEHVFNVPQALKNCMEMTQVGGHFLQANIANNFMGHGFWQFSPELLFRVFSAKNGFEIETVLLHEVVSNGGWYLVADPDSVSERVQLCNSKPTYILTIAKKVSDVTVFATSPLQSDYVIKWEATSIQKDVSEKADNNENANRLQRNLSSSLYRFKVVLKPFRKLLRRNRMWTAQLVRNSLQPWDRPYFKRICKEDVLIGKLK